MTAFLISVFLLCFVRCAVSKFDPTVCSIEEESYGLIPPPLPTNFELKGEYVDHLGNTAVYEEMYFDYTNSRAKYKYLLDSLEYNYLFDYDTQQVVEWIKVHPGTSMKRDPLSQGCEAVDMEDHRYKSLFGYQYSGSRPPKMFNSMQVLRYGGQYLYSANGTLKLSERNMQVNKFQGCFYDPSMKATLKSDCFFADTNVVQPAGGTPSSVVTGYDIVKPLSVPVKFHWTGRYDEGKDIDSTISVSWFKGEPEFEAGTFQIPPWIHCKDYRGRKPIPKLPTAFSTRLMVTTYQLDILGQLQGGDTSSESFEEIYYDSDKKLARRDFTPNKNIDTDIKSKFGNLAPVTTIYDYNEALRYTINKPSGRCYIGAIGHNEYFDSEKELLFKELASPEEIFLMQMDNMEYKGTAFARDIESDVWSGVHYHDLYNTTIVKEVYFSTNGWHVIEDDEEQFRVPVKNVLIVQMEDLNGEAVEGITTYDFLKFKIKPPKMAAFDIKNCVEQINHKRFAIDLNVDDTVKDLVFKYKFLFTEAAQLYITNKTGVVTPLRVQRLRLIQTRTTKRVFLVFSLLDKVDLKRSTVLVGQRGKDLEDAIPLLQRLVESGAFVVQFKDPNTDSNIAVSAVRGGLYIMTGDGNLTPAPLNPAKSPEVERDEEKVELKDEEKVDFKDEEREGMTSGHLALLAFAMLFIGVGIGIAVMYLYIRVYAERQVEDRIDMGTRAGPSSTSADTF